MKKSSSRLPKSAWLAISLCVLVAFAIWLLLTLHPGSLIFAGADENSPLYDASAEIQAAKARLASDKRMARLARETESTEQKLGLSFQGMAPPAAMEKILELLQAYNKTASFFVSGVNATEDENTLSRAVLAGHTVGSYGLKGEKHMEQKGILELLEDFCRANKIIKMAAGKAPTRMMLNATGYTQALRQAAWASGIHTIEQTTHFINFKSFSSYAQVQGYVDRLPRASIIAFKLEGPLDETEYEPPIEDDKPAIDMQDTIENDQAQELDIASLSDEERLVLVVEWLLKALDNTNYIPEAADLLEKNQGALAQEHKEIRTTRPASTFLFYDLSNVAELNYVLDALDETKAGATFLITMEEAAAYAEQVRAVIARGYDMGIALKPQKNQDAFTYCTQILRCQQILKEQYGYGGANVVMLPYGPLDDNIREAVSASGCTLLSPATSITKHQDEFATDPEAVYEGLFGGTRTILHRGHIVYFRMNFYRASDTLLGDMVRLVVSRNATYPIEPAAAILADKALLYTYPLPAEAILPEVRDKIYAGQLTGDLMERVENHYIGNVDIRTSGHLPGFSSQELRRVDHKGLIKNDENAIFITIDDWGSDDTITKLLDVLRKHNAKASFCVRTNYIYANPNLLRAIALEGHDVVSHTHSHYALANYVGGHRYAELTLEELQVLQADLIRSYQELQSVVGDVRLENGKPALTTLFRPPTLAVSRAGMETVFDAGFSYIVSGAYTSGDYIAESAEKLSAQFRRNIDGNGTIVVLHMSDNSLYTADALDAFLTENEKKPEAKRFVCRRLSDYLDGSYANSAR